MNIYECERQARDVGFNSAKFEAMFSGGTYECQWLDAYMGLFRINADGLRDGFVRVRDIAESYPNLVCMNLRAAD